MKQVSCPEGVLRPWLKAHTLEASLPRCFRHFKPKTGKNKLVPRKVGKAQAATAKAISDSPVTLRLKWWEIPQILEQEGKGGKS